MSPQFRSARRHLLLGGAASMLGRIACAQAPADWPGTLAAARGQTVHFNAWAGSERINAYLQWAAAELQRLHGVTLRHVKVADTAEVVQRLRAERAAGRTDGSVDMVWINGENFLRLKREALLFGPFVQALPAFALVDVAGKPTTLVDFSEPVDGLEAPWGMAQLTFYADTARVKAPPQSTAELLAWARANPGRFSYPRPPQFLGTTFLKQVLTERLADRTVLQRPASADAASRLAAPLWAWLDELHPHLWRGGRAFPASDAQAQQMLADGELHIGFTFNPNEAANQVAARRLPASVVSWQFSGGTLGNTHFLAIPANASAKAGAQVAINFLLSPEAQARKADIVHWGDPTVLALHKLGATQRALFAAAQGAPGAVARPAPTLPEPHASWVEPLEREWLVRYGRG